MNASGFFTLLDRLYTLMTIFQHHTKGYFVFVNEKRRKTNVN